MPRVNADFSQISYQRLLDLAARTGKTQADVLRTAVGMYSWYVETRALGNHLLVERPDGSTREVSFG